MAKFTAKDIARHTHEYGDIFLTCPVYINKGIHQKENECVLQYTCALLNSGGGILVMQNMDHNHRDTQSKSLDSWWSGMECNLTNILSGDDICHFLDFIGNYDDQYFYLFVKSAEHLCTVEYHCRLPTDTATHHVTYKSAAKLCSKTGKCGSLSDLPPVPTVYVYGKTEQTLKQEGKQIQFKLLCSVAEYSKKAFADKVSYYCTKYISAFANHEGGHIYFGIEDTTANVMGEVLSEADEAEIVKQIKVKMESVIWGDTRFAAVKGVHWDIRFFPVRYSPPMHRRCVIVVSVCKMYGGVFLKCPESYVLKKKSGNVKNGESTHSVRKLTFDQWKSELLNQDRDIKSFRTRFVKVPFKTPQSRLVFSLPHTIQAAREKVIYLSQESNLQPKHVIQTFEDEAVKKAVTKLISTFCDEPHLVISLNSWGLQLDKPAKLPGVMGSLAVFSSLYGLHVITLVSGGASESEVWQYTAQLAVSLKQVLVHHGGCTNHLGIKVHVQDVNAPLMLEYFQAAIDIDIYPQTYKLREESLNDILTALTIAISSYKPFSSPDDHLETDHYFLLTCDQLELLWVHQFTKELWVHGPPGSGKTIAAMEMVRELRNRGCSRDEILYVAENPLLCSYVGSFDQCLVVSRRELMMDSAVTTTMSKKYGQVRNVIVDEAQNFKDRDGDWYCLLEKFSRQHQDSTKQSCTGYFWVFMDYAQKVHKFKAGLPGLIGKNNFMLREISRNTKEIYEYATKFMEKPKEGCVDATDAATSQCMWDSPQLGHDYTSGHGVDVVKCDQSSVHDALYGVLKRFTDMGISLDDMAILVSKKTEAEEVEKAVKQEELLKSVMGNASSAMKSSQIDGQQPDSSQCHSEHITQNTQTQQTATETKGDESPMETDSDPSKPSVSNSSHVLVSTVREFSGLDKPVIIGLNPHTDQKHADLDKFLLNLITRAKDSLVILTTSDQLLEKLNSNKTNT